MDSTKCRMKLRRTTLFSICLVALLLLILNAATSAQEKPDSVSSSSSEINANTSDITNQPASLETSQETQKTVENAPQIPVGLSGWLKWIINSIFGLGSLGGILLIAEKAGQKSFISAIINWTKKVISLIPSLFRWVIVVILGCCENIYFCRGCFAQKVVLCSHSRKRLEKSWIMKLYQLICGDWKKRLYCRINPQDNNGLDVEDVYIRLETSSRQKSRKSLWNSGTQQVTPGIFVAVGEPFAGRKTFLERELTKQNTDVLEVREEQWLKGREAGEGDEVAIEVDKRLAKRIGALWHRGMFHRPLRPKVVLLLGPSFQSETPQLLSVLGQLKSIVEKFVKKNKPLTVVLKTNALSCSPSLRQ